MSKATDSIENSADVLDSRDIIERIEYLKDELESRIADYKEESEPEALNNLCEWLGVGVSDDLLTELKEDAPELFRWFERAEAVELKALEALSEECSGYGDWEDGVQLIRDSYFQDYAQELAEDCGMIPHGLGWPCTCIDWERATSELQMDYTSAEFDGVTYWLRSC